MARNKTSWLDRASNKSSKDENGCLLFNGGKTIHGYGRINDSGTIKLLHRLSYEEFKGSIPTGIFVCHKCDTPNCWNPEHLFLGTQADNMRDKVGKNRQRKGEDIPSSKLSEMEVLEIKDLLAQGDITQKDIASRYNINRSQISYIKTGKYWKHSNKKES